jgi:carotenoid 1,2-hydratase
MRNRDDWRNRDGRVADLSAGCDSDQPGRFRADVSGDGGRAVRGSDPWTVCKLSPAGEPHQTARLLSGGGQRASGAGGSDGSAFGAAGGGERAAGFRFDGDVAQNGYRWWYIDALSADNTRACTIIAFIGSVFSPYYAAARRAGSADPRNYVALNVALYGLGGPGWSPGWSMTERRRDMLAATPDRLRIGLSALEWRDGALTITVDERTAPIPSRLQGRIVLRPHALFDTVFELDVAGRHRWTPLAPCAAVEVDLTSPGWRWSGHGYLDTNEGDRALEQDFATWQWSRATMPDGSTVVLYDATRRDSTRLGLARRFLPAGSAQSIRMPAVHDVAAGRWGMSRSTHGDAAPVALARGRAFLHALPSRDRAAGEARDRHS